MSSHRSLGCVNAPPKTLRMASMRSCAVVESGKSVVVGVDSVVVGGDSLVVGGSCVVVGGYNVVVAMG